MNRSATALVIKYLFAFVIIIIYMYILFHIPNELFRDRQNYILYAHNINYFFSYSKSEFSYYTNEPLFLYIADLFKGSPDAFPLTMGAFVGFIYITYLTKLSKNVIVFIAGFLLLIFNTFLIYPQLMQLRQGLATSLFLILFFSLRNDKVKIFLSLFLPFIHVVFILITPLYIIYQIYLKSKTTIKILSYTAISTLIVSFAFFAIAGLLGLRQAVQYEDFDNSSGGGSLLLHFFVFIYIYYFGNKENEDLYNWTLIGLVVYICSYLFIPSPGRVFVSFYPFILYILVTKSRLKDIFILIVLNVIFIILFFKGGLRGMLTTDEQSFYVEFLRALSI